MIPIEVEWIVIQSKQVLEWQEQARTTACTETCAANLLEALEVRLGPVPQSLVERVRGESDDVVLQRWFKLALRAATLDQFLQASGMTNNGK